MRTPPQLKHVSFRVESWCHGEKISLIQRKLSHDTRELTRHVRGAFFKCYHICSTSSVLGELRAGDIFGEHALLKNCKRGATVTASEEVEVCVCLSVDHMPFIYLNFA